MDAKDAAVMRKQVRGHLGIFLLLLGVTATTVALTYLPMASSWRTGLQVTLAVIAGGLILGFNMHLLSERLSTRLILGCTFVLFAVLMVLVLFASHNHPELTESGTGHSPGHAPSAHVP